MLNKLRKLFSSPKPLFAEGQRLTPLEDMGANYSQYMPVGITYYTPNQYCSIKQDMILIYHCEDSDKIYFRVRSCFNPRSTEAIDKAIIYFKKKHFKTNNFLRI